MGALQIFIHFELPISGGEFVNRVMTAVANKWPGLKLVHGKPRPNVFSESIR